MDLSNSIDGVIVNNTSINSQLNNVPHTGVGGYYDQIMPNMLDPNSGMPMQPYPGNFMCAQNSSRLPGGGKVKENRVKRPMNAFMVSIFSIPKFDRSVKIGLRILKVSLFSIFNQK